ncbi:MAG: hypothetical protein WBE71_05340, partial [Xanthobacteraceae bacterium]
LAPVTADAMAKLILDDVIEPAIRPFGLERFLPARAAKWGNENGARDNPREWRERTARRAANA